jgi:hypothetical protein
MIRLAVLLLIAAQQVAPLRTATISGVVVDETGSPVGRAWLGLTSADLPGARTAITADDGRFAFTNLPAGRFRLQATKPFHQGTEFGQRTAEDLATTIRLTEGQRLTDLRLRLPRTGSIRGRFVDETGTVVSLHSFADVRLSPEVRRRTGGGLPSLRLPYLSLDGRGGFKVERLPAGTYELRASSRSPIVQVAVGDGQQVSDVLLPMAKEDATPVTSEIEGDVVGPDGRPMNGVQFRLISMDSDPPVQHHMRGSTRPDDRGHFVIKDIPAGRYLLTANAAIHSEAPAERTFRSFWASSEIVVAENIKAYANLALRPGVTVRGRIVFDGTTLGAPPFSRVGIGLVPHDGPASLSALVPGNVAGGVASPDGSFGLLSVPPGRYTVRVSAFNGMQNLMEGWSLESAMLNGVDVVDVPFTVTGEDVTGITVRVSDQTGTLEGTTKNAAGESVFDSTVIVFPVDARAWTASARRIRAARPDTSGTFVFSGLPGGDYFVSAVGDIEPQAWLHPRTLAALSGTATRVSIVSASPMRVALIVR